jgi:hypothetical protein
MKLTPDDIKKVRETLAYISEDDRLSDLLDEHLLLQETASTLKYPINTKAELISQLFQKKPTVRMGDADITPSLVKQLIPAYYFPIANDEDFIEKGRELMKAKKADIEATSPNASQLSRDQAPPIPPTIARIPIPASPAPAGTTSVGYTTDSINKLSSDGGK